ncbi:MAG: hypothetical protein E4H01_05415 [Lysobacterales bacterium]|nr:MAG: hypothetical protein E4H01_05415 [Xanthomonadales bacterium]
MAGKHSVTVTVALNFAARSTAGRWRTLYKAVNICKRVGNPTMIAYTPYSLGSRCLTKKIIERMESEKFNTAEPPRMSGQLGDFS